MTSVSGDPATAGLDTWLVGGAVRDALLGLPVGDRDHVVVGATPQRLRDRGFRQVGRDFPVFLHPRTHDEYALARTERKSGRGYTGFVVHAAPDVTLEDDLARRDFTINAIAQAPDGRWCDPFDGRGDIARRVLRHVGHAFVEDPLRVLRAARFMARLAPLGFTVAEDTLALMRRMADSGELAELVPERVWQELAKALRSPAPSAFLQTLRTADALRHVLPEVDALYGVPQRAEYHPEVDTGLHVELVCDMAARLAIADELIGFCALTHDLGKALTPADMLPRHIQHEWRGLEPLRQLAQRLKVPTEHRQLAEIVCREHLNVHRVAEMTGSKVLDLIERCDGLRKPQRIAQLAIACEADKRGRAGLQDVDYPSGRLLLALHAAAMDVRADDLPNLQHLRGPAIGAALRKARIAAINAAKRSLAAPIEPQ